MHDVMSAPLSARAAAARCGVSERTLRRWIGAGLIHADKAGGTFLVDLEAVRTLVISRRGLAADSAAAADMAAASNTEVSDHADTGAADTLQHGDDAPQHLAVLVELVARLHDEVSQAKDDARQHAETAAMWQERAGSLADRLAAAESKLLALTAPESPLEAPGEAQPVEPAVGPSAPRSAATTWLTPRRFWIIAALVLVLVSVGVVHVTVVLFSMAAQLAMPG